jgi:hypothetical protein
MLERLLKAPVEIRTPDGLVQAAWKVADELGWAKTYDAHYVALADRLAKRLDIWRHVADARAYTPSEIDEVQSRLINARNISTHGADAALLDLGWTGGDRPLRYELAAATDLSLAALSRDLNTMLFAIGEALRGAWKEMRAADFDEGAFETLLAP